MKVNLMTKLVFVFVTFVALKSAHAQNAFEFYIECTTKEADCRELAIEGSAEKIRIGTTPSMTVQETDLVSAVEGSGDVGGDVITLELLPAAAQKLAALTESHRTERLAVVVENTVLMAPTIQARVSDKMQISLGYGRTNVLFQKMPWLRSMSEKRKTEIVEKKRFKVLAYGAAGLAVLIGVIYFAFATPKRGAHLS